MTFKAVLSQPVTQSNQSSGRFFAINIRSEASFQMIVLGHVFELSQSPTMIVAARIRQLVNDLDASIESKDVDTQVHLCSLMCNLFHMRAGIVNVEKNSQPL